MPTYVARVQACRGRHVSTLRSYERFSFVVYAMLEERRVLCHTAPRPTRPRSALETLLHFSGMLVFDTLQFVSWRLRPTQVGVEEVSRVIFIAARARGSVTPSGTLLGRVFRAEVSPSHAWGLMPHRCSTCQLGICK